ncbi:MAG: MFS transporter [Pseudomonadota bacterium]
MAAKNTLALAGLMCGAFAIGTDFTGALLLVPSIESDFSADITTTQWVLNIYALTFAMFMVSGGRLGDLRGHRRMMLAGFTVFIAASFSCYLAPSVEWLIAARAVQGVGAALIWPCIIAKGATVIEGDSGLGLGLVLAGVTAGNVIGPLISGLVVSYGDWRLFFLINTLVGLLALTIAALLLEREHPHDVQERIDFGGVAVLSGAVLSLMVALDQGAAWGWQSQATLALFGVSLVLLIVFPFVEKRSRDPLLPLDMLGNRDFVIALSGNALNVPAIFISFLYFPQFMTKTLAWTVMEASYGMTPLMVLLAVGSVLAGVLYKDFGAKRLLIAGYALITAGTVFVILLKPDWGYDGLLPALILIGLGGTLTVTTSGTAAVGSVHPSRTGLAGGLSFMAHLVVGAIGVAVATAVMVSVSAATLARELTAAGIALSADEQRTLNGLDPDTPEVKSLLSGLSPEESAKVGQILVDAFASGLSAAYWCALIPAAIGLVLMFALDEKKLEAPKAA